MKGFIYSCIGSNTAENREHLEKIGYKIEGFKKRDKFIYTSGEDGWYMILPQQLLSREDDLIDCRNNTDLFRAVTAIRSDSDYLQWYKTDFDNKLIPDVKEMYLCKSREFSGITVKYKGEDFVIGTAGFHKASIAELQEHFK